MKEFEFGGLVISMAGRDKGELFVIIGTEEEYVILADGKHRIMAKPKRKKKKHVQYMKYQCSDLKARRDTSGIITDDMIRRELKIYRKQHPLQQETAGKSFCMDADESPQGAERRE